MLLSLASFWGWISLNNQKGARLWNSSCLDPVSDSLLCCWPVKVLPQAEA